jgi:quinol monooxygenase YgiN
LEANGPRGETLKNSKLARSGVIRSPAIHGRTSSMIFIVVKFNVKPDWSERWLDLTRDFTEATRREPGNLWFEWSRSVENPNEFVLVEAFEDDAAGAHVNSDHFQQAMQQMPEALVETPKIISRQLEGSDWDRMGELAVV